MCCPCTSVHKKMTTQENPMYRFRFSLEQQLSVVSLQGTVVFFGSRIPHCTYIKRSATKSCPYTERPLGNPCTECPCGMSAKDDNREQGLLSGGGGGVLLFTYPGTYADFILVPYRDLWHNPILVPVHQGTPSHHAVNHIATVQETEAPGKGMRHPKVTSGSLDVHHCR